MEQLHAVREKWVVADDKIQDTSTSEKLDSALSSLTPIRDLARNWDINIASCLEDYLQELVEISEGTDTDFSAFNATNFAQAALLLQNSSSVYSRKVEYLHSLVYSTLSELQGSVDANSKKKEKPKNLTEHQQALEKFETFDKNSDFLLMDEVLPTFSGGQMHKINIDLDERTFPLDRPENFSRFMNDSDAGLVQNDLARLSLGGLSVTRLERSACATQDEENSVKIDIPSGNNFLFRSLISEMIDGENGSGIGNGGSCGKLRLIGGKCVISKSGAFLIPGTSIYDSQTEQEEEKEDLPDEFQKNAEDYDNVCNIDDNASFDCACNDEMESSLNNDHNDYVEDGNDHDDQDGIGFELNSNDKNTVEYNENSTSLHPSLIVSEPPAVTKSYDPWLLLDPLSEEKVSSKKIKVRKTYRLPPGISEPPSECVTGARTKSSYLRRMYPNKNESQTKANKKNMAGQNNAVNTFEFIMESLKRREYDAQANANEDKNDNDTSSSENKSDCRMYKFDNVHIEKQIPLQGLAFGDEFAYAAKINAKQRAQNRTSILQDNSLFFSKGHRQTKDNDNIQEDVQEDHVTENLDFCDDAAFGDEYNDDFSEPDEDIQDEGNVKSIFGEDEGGNIEGYINSDQFEELCRAHIKSFARGSERYAINSILSQRIEDWQKKLVPILEEEQGRAEFDVHQYGERILDAIKEDMLVKRERKKRKAVKNVDNEDKTLNCKTVDFRSIAANSEPHDVCRLFLTSLMLSNSGNISLSHECEGRQENFESKEQLHMELLNDNLESPIELYGLE